MPLSFHLPLNKNIQIKVLRCLMSQKKSHVTTLGPGECDVTFSSPQSRPTPAHLPVRCEPWRGDSQFKQ